MLGINPGPLTLNKNPMYSDEFAIEFYLDYFNNYITLAKIAEHRGMNIFDALDLVSRGRKLNNCAELIN